MQAVFTSLRNVTCLTAAFLPSACQSRQTSVDLRKEFCADLRLVFAGHCRSLQTVAALCRALLMFAGHRQTISSRSSAFPRSHTRPVHADHIMSGRCLLPPYALRLLNERCSMNMVLSATVRQCALSAPCKRPLPGCTAAVLPACGHSSPGTTSSSLAVGKGLLSAPLHLARHCLHGGMSKVAPKTAPCCFGPSQAFGLTPYLINLMETFHECTPLQQNLGQRSPAGFPAVSSTPVSTFVSST